MLSSILWILVLGTGLVWSQWLAYLSVSLFRTKRSRVKEGSAISSVCFKEPQGSEAVVDKGLEVMNKLVDKQLKIIDEAQEKASNFLAKNVSASANLGD